MSGGRFEFLARKMESLRQADSLRTLAVRAHEGTTLVDADGTRLINFGANDYLGLAQEVSGTFSTVAEKVPDTFSGAGASPLVSGFTPVHAQLCRALAAWEQTEAAVLFPSGYAACSGAVATLPEEGDLLLSDQLNHASLIDGCRLSAATRVVYPHRDVDSVRRTLLAERHRFARVWIVTDGVFGMDGDVAPLKSLCDVADQFDAHLIVDEAHATGVLGVDGSGTCAELHMKSRVAIRIGTLSKAIGSHGGFVVGPQVVIDYLVNRCRPLIYSTAGSPLTISAALRGIQAIRSEPQRRDRVRALAERFRDQMRGRWLDQDSPADVKGIPIVPVVLGSNELVLRIAARLRDAGFFVPAIRPPTVPPGMARLRVSLSAMHREEDVDRLARALLAVAVER